MQTAATTAAVSAPPPVRAIPAGEGDQRIPLSGMRKVIAERLYISKTTVPHFYLNIEVNAEELMWLRSEVNATAEKSNQPKLTVNDFVLKAAIVAATRVPKVNAAFDGDAIVQYGSINLAVAVAIDDGLVTPGDPRRAEKIAARDQRDGEGPRHARAGARSSSPTNTRGGR